MDQKKTEGHLLAIADGKDDSSRGSTSYAMLPSDRKAVEETGNSARNSEFQIAKLEKAFGDKGWFGLWWDAKGLWNSSKKEAVITYMEKHRSFYEAIAKFTDMVEKGDTNSYKSLLDLYERLSEMEEEAKLDVKYNKSKEVCRMLREFLDERYKLDHNLKRVECAVQRQVIHEVAETCDRAREAADKSFNEISELIKENRELKAYMKECVDQARGLKVENEVCRSLVERLSKEKDEFKDAMEKKFEELSLEADRRSEAVRSESDEKLKKVIEEANKRSEAHIKKIAKQHKSELEKITEMLASMKRDGFNP